MPSLPWQKPKQPIVEEFETLFGSRAMEHWACLGAVTEDCVRVWLRQSPPGRYTITLKVDGAIVAESELETLEAHDCVGIADVRVPTPMPGQAFTVEVAGMKRDGVFAPITGTSSEFTFLIGSCNQPYMRDGEQAVPSQSGEIYGPMLQTARAAGARFSLFMGDQAYADGIPGLSVPEWARAYREVPDERLRALYQQVYRAYFGHPGFMALMEHMPSYLIWDDHEIFDSYGSHNELEAIDRRLFESARAAYVEYQHVHNPGTSFSDQAPFDYHFWFGGAGFFVFDLRSERSYPDGGLIGEKQWDDLNDFLDEAEERNISMVFIVTTIPVIHFSPRGIRLLDSLPGRKASLMRERWDSENFLPHRERLLADLFEWQSDAPNRSVILLSGDVHAAGAFRVYHQDGPGMITQWTSSAMSTPGGFEHLVANRVGSRFVNMGETMCHSERLGVEPKNNFGLVSVAPNTSGPGMQARLTIYRHDTKTGKLTRSITDRITTG
jgi:hypothetical protein